MAYAGLRDMSEEGRSLMKIGDQAANLAWSVKETRPDTYRTLIDLSLSIISTARRI